MLDWNELEDGEARRAFCTETEANFSVVAPAGVGKTTSIVSRILELTEMDLTEGAGGQERVSRLVLVTYTRSAAHEMRERVLTALHRRKAGPMAIAQVGKAFFGTLHSYCLDLVRQNSPALGLPARIESVQDTSALWLEFRDQLNDPLEALPKDVRPYFLSHASLLKVMEIVKGFPLQAPRPPEIGQPPEIDLNAALMCTPRQERYRESLEKEQSRIRDWLRDHSENNPLPFPEIKNGGKEFLAAVNAAFQPCSDWMSDALYRVAHHLSEAFLQFRIQRGKLTFDDQIALALRVSRSPMFQRTLQARPPLIILDEAQDTDPLQFEVLLRVAGAEFKNDSGSLCVCPSAIPSGRFCMVGDPQQSIYRERADLKVYRQIHDAFDTPSVGRKVVFSVTMRCAENIVGWCNRRFEDIFQSLDGNTGLAPESELASQVDYVTLKARPKAPGGRVSCWTLEADAAETESDDDEEETSENSNDIRKAAQALAARLASEGLKELGAEKWCEVAVLAPRKKWLDIIAQSLIDQGINSQSLSGETALGDFPPVAWMAGLFHCMAYPRDTFEVAGVLRELYALRDDQMAEYAHRLDLEAPAFQENGQRAFLRSFALDAGRTEGGPDAVAEALSHLKSLWKECRSRPPLDVFDCLCKRLEIPEKLETLQPFFDKPLLPLLTRTRLGIALLDAQGKGLPECAEALRQEALSEISPEPVKDDCVQLLTDKKAKGLEWTVVVVPMLFRSQKLPNAHFPSVLRLPGGEVKVVFNKYTTRAALKELLRITNEQEIQRLFYVTCTRAKRHLILIDDSSFFGKARKGSTQTRAGICRLEGLLTEAASDSWNTVPAEVLGKSEKQRQPAGAITPDGEWAVSLVEKSSLKRLQEVPRRVLPSSLARHTTRESGQRHEPDALSEPVFPELAPWLKPRPGMDYGNWWHKTMENFPWSLPLPLKPCPYLEERLEVCPDPERGRRELEKLLNSPIRPLLDKSVTLCTEVPFTWQKDQGTVLDGVIDWVAKSSDGCLTLIDWKTDVLSNQRLVECYREQVLSYGQAMQDIYQLQTTCFLYSTLAGDLILCEPSETPTPP